MPPAKSRCSCCPVGGEHSALIAPQSVCQRLLSIDSRGLPVRLASIHCSSQCVHLMIKHHGSVTQVVHLSRLVKLNCRWTLYTPPLGLTILASLTRRQNWIFSHGHALSWHPLPGCQNFRDD